jgi:uncharacterized protein YndB with AHSA1/START domain
MNYEPFVIERTYNAPIEKVWRAITDRDQMKQWYFDLQNFKLEVGNEFSFVGTDNDCKDWVHLCRVTEIIPNKKFAHTWRYEGFDGDTTVIWELFAEGAFTRVKLTHSGLETLPPLRSFARECFAEGWTGLVGESLKNFVEHADFAA